MTRRRSNPRTAQPATAPQAAPAALNARERRQIHLAIDNAPRDQIGSPSLRAAREHAVDSVPRTTREREAAEMAMDFNGTSMSALTFTEATGFPGFPTLSLLAQLPEYRSMHERLADECIRMWGKVTSSGEADDEHKAQLEAELKRLDVRAIIRQLVIHDQAFGGGHVYIKLKGDEDCRDTPLVLRPYTVRRNALEGFRVVEPYWVTPNFYNSIDPTAADFYKPSSWFMIGQEVHATRLQTIMSRPVPDMLKPTYSFRGVSMSQLAMPYVDNWLRTRQSVSDAVKQYAVSGVLMDLQQSLLPGADVGLRARTDLINAYRDNRNLLALDKATEEFFTVSTPLSGLDALQAQAQEQMSAVCHIPLVVLLGITPTGLNASSEGEIRVFYDYVKGYQQNTLSSLMLNFLRVMQLSMFGEIDEDIGWTWEPLLELTALEQSELRKNDSETDERYVGLGVVAPETIQRRLNADPCSLYSGMLEAGDTLETTPDDDIETITAHILDIPVIAPTGAEPAGLLAPTSAPGDMDEESSIADNVAGVLGSANSDPTLTDPGPLADPGQMLNSIADTMVQPEGAPGLQALNAIIDGMGGTAPAGEQTIAAGEYSDALNAAARLMQGA